MKGGGKDGGTQKRPPDGVLLSNSRADAVNDIHSHG